MKLLAFHHFRSMIKIVGSGSGSVVESLPLMRVQSCAAPTKAHDKALFLGPYHNGGPACSIELLIFKTYSHEGGPIVFPSSIGHKC